MNSEPSHFLTFIKNGKIFSSFLRWHAAITALNNFSFYKGIGKPEGIGFLETFINVIN